MTNTTEEKIIEKGYLTLYSLILNIRGNEVISITNEDDNTSFTGNEEEIETSKKEWLDLRVSNIYSENNQIKVMISKEI